MKVLIVCEESQEVCKAFRGKGHWAFSCDIQPCSGGHPEWHILGDAMKVINGKCRFETEDGIGWNIVGKWDLIIAHPPCTYLSNVATRAFSLKCTPAENVVKRWEQRAKAAVFFMRCMLADCDKICVENPVGFMTSAYKPPTQYIHPYMFATGTDDTDNYHKKKTGLWLKGLEPLKPNGIVEDFDCATVYGRYSNGKAKTWEDTSHGSKNRSKTFPGVAKAMAEQWG